MEAAEIKDELVKLYPGADPERLQENTKTMTTGAYQRHGVDGADDDGGQPKSDDGAAGVCDDGGLVLDGVPLSQSTTCQVAKF